MLQMGKTTSFALRCELIDMAVQMSEILENFQSVLCPVNTKNHWEETFHNHLYFKTVIYCEPDGKNQ